VAFYTVLLGNIMTLKFYARASTCFVALVSASAHADENTDAIIVIGQREAPIAIAPRGLAVSLGAEQFSAVNAFNVEDLIKYAPNFFVRKRFTGDSNGVPGFRGTHSTQSARALVIVDGFVVSNFLGNSFGFAPKWGVVGPGEVKQFDIVYGPYSSRYVGNSIGGIVNITTRDPETTEAFANAQVFAQPYKQYSTDETYYGSSVEVGAGWKQVNGPFSARITTRFLQNKGQPQSWYFLTPAAGLAPGIAVTGAVIDPDVLTRLPNGDAAPIFAAQSPAEITQSQTKLKLGFESDDIKAQAVFIYWWNLDRQSAPETYLRDVNGAPIYEGRVTTLGRTFNASGANWSRTSRKEYLAGIRFEAPIGNVKTDLNISTYQITSQKSFTSNGYIAGRDNGSGTLAEQGPTSWYTLDAKMSYTLGRNEFTTGVTANLYKSDQTRFNIPNWRNSNNINFSSQTFGKTRLLAGWIENRFCLTDGITLTGGARVENWRAFNGGVGRVGTGALVGQRVFNAYATRTDTAVNPSASIEIRIDDNTRAQLSLATATRFPTVGELFQGSLNGDGSFNSNSFDPNLKPEHSQDVNFLLSHDFGSIKITGSAFWQQVNNTLFSVTGFNQFGIITTSFKNIDRTRQYGAEVIVETRDWPILNMAIDTNAAYNNSKTLKNRALPTSEGVAFPRIPTWRLNGNIRYHFKDAVQGTLGFRYASRPNTDLEGLQRGDTFGYTSELFALDARLTYSMTENVKLSAGVDNITNNRAWVFHPYPQRTFVIEANWKY
jgi:iron complex outermembrane recepter protein